MLGTKQAMSTAYHPQTDGQTERVNRVLEDMLRMYVSKAQTDWDEKLSCAEFAINNAEHSSTGFTPFMDITRTFQYRCCPKSGSRLLRASFNAFND